MFSHPVVAALATRRLTALVVEDEITKPLRQAVNRWAKDSPEFSLRERIDFMVNCGACASVWAAGAVLLLDRFTAGRLVLQLLATSAAAQITEAVTQRIQEGGF